MNNKADEENIQTQSEATEKLASSEENPESQVSVSPAVNGDDKGQWLVKFEEHDPANPKNFKTAYKIFLTFQMSMLALSGSMGSSIVAPAQSSIGAYFHVSVEVTTLAVALFVLGWAFGPMIWGPISEVYGRRWGMLPGVFIFGLFSIGSATSKSAASLFVTRFFGGIFASAPISNVPAALGDLYDPRFRGTAMTFVSLCIVGGPTLGPVIGAALTVNSHLGWRWTEYIESIFIFTLFFLALFTLPEIYAPVLLKRRAQHLRKTTGKEQYWHPHEEERISLDNVLTKHISRPIRMFVTEPMLTFIAVYASFVYSLVYLTLEVFPIVFHEKRKYSLVISTLPFFGILVGVMFALIINFANQPSYARAVKNNNGQAVPEARLPPMIAGGILLSVGLFWFGWTADPKFSWALPVVASGFIGAGFNIVFQQCLNFIVDTYGMYSASAVSANTMLRSILACGLPMASRPMFENLGVGPASSLIGGISCLAIPVPFFLMKYSAALRERSKFAPTSK
ncbi:major facilitator superfamily domain-containing protein [Talaromyces proteolyticus]|uniref:Major facilitator superfamily domain-containing protein n=1 Tax=Talaromyces proteolyticus TaxID=1131652 RepID=A0AAD4KQX3_9EURO|nr:major facilitator superfamily domain-containing protein [Talaromyces proteolyticus]KAH8694094.1 major facilitator superfamily domain-containing protein [Talaromyces proteolyticus]